MSFYIVCQKKRNNPRMDVRICQKKCDMKDDCEEYLAFHKAAIQNKDIHLTAKSQSIELELALENIS